MQIICDGVFDCFNLRIDVGTCVFLCRCQYKGVVIIFNLCVYIYIHVANNI